MNELREAIATVLELASQMIDELDDETMLALTDLINAATERLDREEENPVDGHEQNIPIQLEPGPYPSSNVNSFKYNPNTQQLYVKFHGKDSAESGPTYLYQNIPGFIYDVFSKGSIGPKTSGENRYHRWIKNVTPSLGGTLNALIKAGNFPYQRLT